jgi:hypothetical protein
VNAVNNKIAAILLTIFLTGCTTGQGYGTTPATHAQTTSSDEKTAQNTASTRTLPPASPPLFVEFSQKCPMSGQGSPEFLALPLIAGTLLKSVADTVIPSTVGWLYDKGTYFLDKQHTKLLSSSTATNTTNYYNRDSIVSSFGCIIIARAERGVNISGEYARSRHGNMNILPSESWGAAPAADQLKELKMSKAPEFYFELGLTSYNASVAEKEASPGKEKNTKDKGRPATVLATPPAQTLSLYRAVKPARLDYFDTGAENQGKDRAKFVSLEVNMEAMDDKREWKQIFSKTYDFGLLKIGLSDIPVQSLGSDVFVPPFFSDKSKTYIDPVPVRITAILTETDDGADLARVVALSLRDAQARKATVKAVSDTITGQITSAIDARLGKPGADGAATTGNAK